ncbi:MAG: ribonuclease HII [Patescibacteria group bacterium]
MSIGKFPSLKYEKKLWRGGFKLVVGADEAGRGALAGSIVAAAVVFSPTILKYKAVWLKQVKDSKKLTPAKRELLFKKIIKEARVWAVSLIDNKKIDKYGIQAMNIKVVNQAVAKLKIKPDYLLVDYIAGFKSKLPFACVIKGDQKVFSIACASIVAKVWRDRLMKNYHKKYPRYGFRENKGYGTLKHHQAIKKHGVCSIHRKSFRAV